LFTLMIHAIQPGAVGEALPVAVRQSDCVHNRRYGDLLTIISRHRKNAFEMVGSLVKQRARELVR